MGLGGDQVHHRQHCGQSAGKLGVGADRVGDAGRGDLGAGPYQALGHGGPRHQEGAGDGRYLEPGQRAQREGHLSICQAMPASTASSTVQCPARRALGTSAPKTWLITTAIWSACPSSAGCSSLAVCWTAAVAADRSALSSSGYPMSCKCDPASAKWASPSGAATPSPDSTMLALCRDWLIATGGHGVRQEGYQTAAGEMVEFFADADAADAPELSEETHAYLFGAL